MGDHLGRLDFFAASGREKAITSNIEFDGREIEQFSRKDLNKSRQDNGLFKCQSLAIKFNIERVCYQSFRALRIIALKVLLEYTRRKEQRTTFHV